MKTISIELRNDHIRLCDLLKQAGLAQSGAQGKHLVADGLVTVDGQPESRKTAKIVPGQVVHCKGIRVKARAAFPGAGSGSAAGSDATED